VIRLLANVAGPGGTLLVLDDLQWAGTDALDLLRVLVHAAAEGQLRVLGAYRDMEVAPADPLSVLLADLAQAGLAAQRALAPLPPAEAAELFDAVLDEGPGNDGRARLVLAETLVVGATSGVVAVEARVLLEEARDQFAASGAALDLARAERLAAAWGVAGHPTAVPGSGAR
jgi:hypothetical protein